MEEAKEEGIELWLPEVEEVDSRTIIEEERKWLMKETNLQ